MHNVVFGCRALVGIVFAFAVIGKFRDFSGFRDSVRRLVPWAVARDRAGGGKGSATVNATAAATVTTVTAVTRITRITTVTAVTVVVAESLTVVLLAVPRTVLGGFVIALALDLAFVIGIVLALRRGEREPCHCFGVREAPLGRRDVVRDLVLAGVVGVGLVGDLHGTAPGPAAGALIACVAGVVGALLVVFLDDLVELFVPAPLQNSPDWGRPSEARKT